MPALSRKNRTVERCFICGFREVRTDFVNDRGWFLLGECPRCEHRYTRPLTSEYFPEQSGERYSLA